MISRTAAQKEFGLRNELDSLRSGEVHRYRGGNVATVFLKADVEAAYRDLTDRKQIEERTKRSARAKGAANRRREQTLKEVAAIELKIPMYEWNRLVKLACNHFNEPKNDKVERATPDSDDLFLNRIVVNFLRHECTQYDEQCGALSGRVGRNDAWAAWKERVLDAIADAYPELFSECYRQIKAIYES